MPGVWLVQAADGTEERIEAGVVATAGGPLGGISLGGRLTRGLAPRSRQPVRPPSGVGAHPACNGNDSDGRVGLHMA